MKVSHGIGFYIPNDEIIPTKLRLKVDGKYVEYQREAGLSYVFDFYHGWTTEEASEAIKRIAGLMETQSDDGYIRWVPMNIEQCGLTSFKITFRVRDAG